MPVDHSAVAFLKAKRETQLSDEVLLVLLRLKQSPATKEEIVNDCGVLMPTLGRYLENLKQAGHVEKLPRRPGCTRSSYALSAHGERLVRRITQTLKGAA